LILKGIYVKICKEYFVRRHLFMHLKFEKCNDVLIVYLFGELDHHNAEALRVKIDDRIDRDEIKKVILSFKAVSFMDSSGIGAVIGRYKKINGKGGSLCVVDIDERINRVFELSGLYKIIKHYKNTMPYFNIFLILCKVFIISCSF